MLYPDSEEKINPSTACYFICTVESMPKNKEVDFVAIDEIQMCADRERGHIFTERLLEFRGTKLTMFLGSQVMKKIIGELITAKQIKVLLAKNETLLFSDPALDLTDDVTSMLDVAAAEANSTSEQCPNLSALIQASYRKY